MKSTNKKTVTFTKDKHGKCDSITITENFSSGTKYARRKEANKQMNTFLGFPRIS